MALYLQPSAKVKVNGLLSDGFEIRNGTRQGCPLSLMLFALVLETFLRKVRANPDISGVTVGPKEHKLSAYADDILFYLTNPVTSLPNLTAELTRFGALSALKINQSKSEALPIVLPEPMASTLKQSFPYTRATESIKYLGISDGRTCEIVQEEESFHYKTGMNRKCVPGCVPGTGCDVTDVTFAFSD